jgi:hypothetical protein
MMKVHSVLLSQAVEDSDRGGKVQPLVRTRRERRAGQLVVLDGPFTESKESCLHVAILAGLLKDLDGRMEQASSRPQNDVVRLVKIVRKDYAAKAISCCSTKTIS